ncbi:GtrA family protein [Sodalis sp. dw_96]|uniref:GtrA family protein n=1 Tax=Sodalis sp. dw_96 TaxID=2719794 RepID=UPI001BD4C673|nr:GtrA family protein [Sodalis sp. dw_96]
MNRLFYRYVSVGIVNTLIHWAVFAIIRHEFTNNQAICNFIGFGCAVTFSFFANAKFTFKRESTVKRYILFVGFLGMMSIVFGLIADTLNIQGLYTLISFSVFSLVCGFLYSKYVVFKEVTE